MILKMARDENLLPTSTYQKSITFDEVKTSLPIVKILRLYCDTAELDDIKNQLIKQNDWIRADDFEVVDKYFTQLPNERKFATIIVETHVELLKRGFIIYGLKKSSVNEHAQVLQCGRCRRYGHTRVSCQSSDPICRKCAGNHISSQCKASERVKKCHNCEEGRYRKD